MTNKMSNVLMSFGIVGFIFFAIIIVICGPLASIWSLNLLFGFEIPYDWNTWLAAAWLAYVISGGYGSTKSKNNNG